MSEDPSFLTIGINRKNDEPQLSNPQNMNSYSYVTNNPLTMRDPDGRCPWCVPLVIAGGVGAIGGMGSQAFNDYLSGDFGTRSIGDTLNTYAVAAGKGAFVGLGTATAALAAPAIAIPTMVTVGGTAGTLTAGTTMIGNYLLGQQADLTGLVTESGVAALTAGTLHTLPKVPGRMPNLNTKSFYTGVHTRRQWAEEFLSNSMQTLRRPAMGALSGSVGCLNCSSSTRTYSPIGNKTSTPSMISGDSYDAYARRMGTRQ